MSSEEIRVLIDRLGAGDPSETRRALAQVVIQNARRDKSLKNAVDELHDQHMTMSEKVDDIADAQEPLREAYSTWRTWRGWILTGIGALVTAVLASGGQAILELIMGR